MSDFETMPIGTAKRINEFLTDAEVILLKEIIYRERIEELEQALQKFVDIVPVHFGRFMPRTVSKIFKHSKQLLGE